MQALVFEGPGSAIVRDVARPTVAADEVLVGVRRAGICHSDLGLLTGDYILPIPWPIIPGHEWVGVVEEVGSMAVGFSVGDRVVGECAVADDTHVGFTRDGAAAEQLVAKPAWLHRIPDALDDTLGALVEPFTVGYAATAGVDASDDVVVLGGGPIGLCAVAAAAGRGARVLLVDPHEDRRLLGTHLGADAVLVPNGLEEAIAEETEGRMASHVVEAAGRPGALSGALGIARFGATIVALGITVGTTEPAEMGLIMGRALTIRGQVGSAGVWPEAIRFLERTRTDLSALVTTSFPLSEGPAALDAARHESIKTHLVVGNA